MSTDVATFPCVYLRGNVELSSEREHHIAERHPDLLPEHRRCIADTVGDPDAVRWTARMPNAHLFTRWFDGLRGGKHVLVVVVSETEPPRHWIVTAYIARKLAEGDVGWTRS